MPKTSYLSTRTPAEAWGKVRELLEANAWNQRAVARRLHVHERTFYRWLSENGFTDEIERLRKEYYERQIEG